MQRIMVAALVAMAVAGGTLCASAGSNIYGVGGLIETPGDSLVPLGGVSITGHYISEFFDSDDNVFAFGGAVGITPRLEVSAVGLDSDAPGVDTSALISGKFRIFSESIERPSVTVGIVDIADELEDLNSEIDNPSFFVVFAKNLMPDVGGLGGIVARPLRGSLGFGTGLYKGVFAGLNWSAAPRVDVLAEYLSNGLRQKSTFNAALRFTPVRTISVQGGTIGFEDFYVGATVSFGGF